jgi:hypothetical protein
MAKIVKTSAEGRKCQFPDCNRTLSIYNHERYCHSHLYMMSEEEKIRSTLHSGPLDLIGEKLRQLQIDNLMNRRKSPDNDIRR